LTKINLSFIFLFLFLTNSQGEKISLQLQWLHQFQFAGYYIAKEKGFYQKRGLDVEIKEYEKEINVRETAGTPGILQLIRAALAYQLRNEIGFEFIKNQKKELLNLFLKEIEKIPNITIYGNRESENIGIISFNIENINPYDICARLSQDDGIQTRAGCSCAGPYGHDLLGFNTKEEIEQKPGWLRISIHYSQTKEEIENLVKSLRKAMV